MPGARLPEGACVTDNFGRKLCSQVNTKQDDNGFAINLVGRLNPNHGFLRAWENVGNSIYHSLQLSVQKQMSHGFQIAGNYTWSHATDSGSSWRGFETANGFAAGDAVTTDETLPGLDRGNATFDIRHRLTLHYVWELPFFRNSHGWPGTILGGWQWNGIWSFQSGAHWSPFRGGPGPNFRDNGTGACDPASFDPTRCFNVGADYNLDGVANDRPNAIANLLNVTHAQWADGFEESGAPVQDRDWPVINRHRDSDRHTAVNMRVFLCGSELGLGFVAVQRLLSVTILSFLGLRLPTPARTYPAVPKSRDNGTEAHSSAHAGSTAPRLPSARNPVTRAAM